MEQEVETLGSSSVLPQINCVILDKSLALSGPHCPDCKMRNSEPFAASCSICHTRRKGLSPAMTVGAEGKPHRPS